MTRRRFFLAAPLLPLAVLAGEPKGKSIRLLSFCAAGVQYHEFAKNPPLARSVHLLREPDNRFDANAIALYAQGRKLGYVPKDQNRVLAALMDGKQPLFARIADIAFDAPMWERYRVEVGMESVG